MKVVEPYIHIFNDRVNDYCLKTGMVFTIEKRSRGEAWFCWDNVNQLAPKNKICKITDINDDEDLAALIFTKDGEFITRIFREDADFIAHRCDKKK